MTAWLVRAGRNGESREDYALENNVAGTGFAEVGDLTAATTRPEIVDSVRAAYPGLADKAVLNYAAQLNALRNRIAVGDIVALPLKQTAQVAIGEVIGLYRYDAMAEPEGRCVVTTEVSSSKKQRQNRKIPDVCADFGISCCNPFEMARALGFSTGWKGS